MATAGPVPTKRPVTKRTNIRSMAFAVAGKEQPYPVYRFSRRPRFERPNSNPFEGL